MSGLRIERVEMAPFKRLQMLLEACRRGEAWPPVAADLPDALMALASVGVSRVWIGVDHEEVRPVSEDDLGEFFEALNEALASWPVPVSVRVEMFEEAPVRGKKKQDEEDTEDDGGKVAVFTLKSQVATAA